MNKLSTYLTIIFLMTFAYLYNKDLSYQTCIKVNEKEDIINILQPGKVPRVVYDNNFDFSNLSVAERKKCFIDMLLPQILIINEGIQEERKRIIELSARSSWSKRDSNYLQEYLKKYKCEDIEELLFRYNIIPPDIVIAQAVIETGWGTSRFFREANNVFGIWSYNENEPRIPATGTRNGKKVFLKKYDNIMLSISDYFVLINSNENYKEIWEMREEDIDQLVSSLTKYSELGAEYTLRIEKIINKNKLKKYREYSLFKG